MFDVGSGESEECRAVGEGREGGTGERHSRSTRKTYRVSPTSLVSLGKGQEKANRSGSKALTKHCHFDGGLPCML